MDVIVVYKVDRLSRSLVDFAQLTSVFDRQDVAFVAVTQQFNTSDAMGRLTLNILLSFAQFERVQARFAQGRSPPRQATGNRRQETLLFLSPATNGGTVLMPVKLALQPEGRGVAVDPTDPTTQGALTA